MMAAMMLPALVAAGGAYAREGRAGGTALFVAGYLGLWVIAGIGAWALVHSVRSLDPVLLHWSDGGRYVAGGVIAAAALYDLTPLKARCLRHCRDSRLLVADWRRGRSEERRGGKRW